MSFILNGGYYEWEIANNGTTWGAANISEGCLSDGCFNQLSVGNVVARQLKLTLWNVALDPAYPLVLTLKKIRGDGTVESIPKGTYFIDTFGTSPYSEYAEVTAYDALLKSEAPFMTSGEWSAASDAALAAEIATRIGVTLDPVTSAYLSASPITINEAPNIGPNGTTIREMLSVIGCLRGGSWIIDDNNNLQLILLNGTPDSVGIVYIGTDGLFYTDDLINMPSSASFVGFDANGDAQAIPKADITDADEVMYISRSGVCEVDTYGNIKVISPDYDTVVIGDEVIDLDVSPSETIKGVEVWAGSKTSYRAWDTDEYATWDDIDGAILVCSMPIMASQTVADNLFSQYEDFTYLPYKASGVYADPELPLGTRLVIKSSTVALTQRELNIDALASCGLSAEATKLAASYYPYLTPVERSLQKDINNNYTAIQVQEGQIDSIVQTFNEQLGINIAELTSHSPTDVYNASSNPNGYWRNKIISLTNASTVLTQLGDGWYHMEFTHSLSSPQGIRFLPVAIPSLDAENLTLMMEVRNASYTGEITFGSAAISSGAAQYVINSADAVVNPSDGAHYFKLTKSTSTSSKTSVFRFGTDTINNGKGLNMDIRLSLYMGAYDGPYVPWSANSYNSRVTQTADGILISLATKITEAEAQSLVDAYGTVVEQYMRFAGGILELGESNSQFKALLSNTKLAFTGADGREVAWISNNQLYINNAIINGSLTIRYDEDATTVWRQFIRRVNENGVDKDIFCIKAVK